MEAEAHVDLNLKGKSTGLRLLEDGKSKERNPFLYNIQLHQVFNLSASARYIYIYLLLDRSVFPEAAISIKRKFFSPAVWNATAHFSPTGATNQTPKLRFVVLTSDEHLAALPALLAVLVSIFASRLPFSLQSSLPLRFLRSLLSKGSVFLLLAHALLLSCISLHNHSSTTTTSGPWWRT